MSRNPSDSILDNDDLDFLKRSSKNSNTTESEIRISDKRRSQQPDYMSRIGESLATASKPEVEKTLEQMIEDCFMEPGPGRVIIQPDVFRYRGSLTIPDSAKRSGTAGTVLKVGAECNALFFDKFEGGVRHFRTLRPGDRVAYGTWTGILFQFDQRPSYRILMENEIATIVNDKATKLLEVEA